MKLSSFLNPDLIFLNRDINSKESAYIFLTEKIVEQNGLSVDKEYILKKLREREKLGSTVLNDKVYLPHARLENYTDLNFAVLRPSEPIDNIQLVILILISAETSTIYLGALSAISKIVADEEIMDALMNADSSVDFINEIKERDIYMKEDVRAEDIMRENVITVNPDMNVKELINLFLSENIFFAPVVDKKGKFLGTVNFHNILQKALPDYVARITNIKFAKGLAPLDKFLKEEENIDVSEIMDKKAKTLNPDSSIIEGMQILRSDINCIVIIDDNNELKGIVDHQQILRNVLRP
ncbi:MAG: PTS sugar transporter subunit IIA [candidate division WOR-3 bacterium]|nr:PTS sugar transporter subunit IIA [candidate division WOR-3 bacterium]